MSFQGDVAGIGLADLLQSLARGRVGVLTLKSREGHTATLGLHTGNLHLLPEPGEDAESWRQRVRRAWVRDPNVSIDSLRMSAVAYAVRLESLYRQFDSEGVHFRFNPGPLPERPAPSASSQPDATVTRGGQTADAVFCNELPVEGVLLEYARLKDDLDRAGGAEFVSDDVVPYLMVQPGGGEDARFLRECDGESTMVEIADRLSWPLRQIRLTTLLKLQEGSIRLAEAHEVIALAQNELLTSNFTRAGARLNAWCLQSLPGPPSPQEADCLANEWSSGRLQNALRTMPERVARTLLRRLDAAAQNPLASIERWEKYAETFKRDPLGHVRLLVAQVRSGVDPNLPALRDLLAIAREQREAGKPMRAAAFLRIAATRELETVASQLEVGSGLVNVGLVQEGAPWIESAAEALIATGQPDKALAPLRALVAADRTNRNARRLLSRARARAVRRRITRKHALIALAILFALLSGAWVEIRMRRDVDRRLDAIEALADCPHDALRLLDEGFAEDDSGRVVRLRASLEQRRKVVETTMRAEWNARFDEAQVECTLGDPQLGLRRALEIAPPPLPADPLQPWRKTTELFDNLVARLEGQLAALGETVVDTPEQIRGEEQLAGVVKGLLESVESHRDSADVAALRTRIQKLETTLAGRGERRVTEREERAKAENLALQDRLLATARSHAKAGDLTRALDVYKKLIETDESGKLGTLLEKEIAQLQVRHDTAVEARDLAAAGRHAEAHDVLVRGFGSAGGLSLPWKVASYPAGARARFADGGVRSTPFELASMFGERVAMTVEADGYDSLELAFDDPADRFLYLSLTPESWWKSRGRVDAMPVAVGDDHVVADRTGRIVRLGRSGEIVWEHDLPSLGGVARAPVFLPKKPGHLLVLTEDGEAWIVEAASGAIDGPWTIGKPPLEGPFATADGVVARFADGEELCWDARLKPARTDGTGEVAPIGEYGEVDELDRRFGSTAGLAVLRRRSGGASRLESPWTSWTVEIQDGAYAVFEDGKQEPLFTVRRDGDWTWVAWEAPSTRAARGRLWTSDSAGLRSFLR